MSLLNKIKTTAERKKLNLYIQHQCPLLIITLACAGPLSLRSLYCGWILLKRANSFTKHIGVFSLGFAMFSWGGPKTQYNRMHNICKEHITVLPTQARVFFTIHLQHISQRFCFDNLQCTCQEEKSKSFRNLVELIKTC